MDMRKLIDPKRLIMHLNDWMFAEGCEEGWNYDKNKVVPDHERQQAIYDTIQQCIDAVMDQPTVDAEPVIRCENCIHHEDEESGMVYCPNIVGGWVSNDWFCADGAKMDEVTE